MIFPTLEIIPDQFILFIISHILLCKSGGLSIKNIYSLLLSGVIIFMDCCSGNAYVYKDVL